jgi:hypothetical protein
MRGVSSKLKERREEMRDDVPTKERVLLNPLSYER